MARHSLALSSLSSYVCIVSHSLNIIHVMVVEHIGESHEVDLLITHSICSSVSFYVQYCIYVQYRIYVQSDGVRALSIHLRVFVLKAILYQ
jgi:hypothetical protein